MLLLILLLFVVCIYSLSVSRLDISFMQALEAVWNHLVGTVPDKATDYSNWWIDKNVMNNGARVVCGICVGAILAICGAIMQSITRNPLTDPYTIGISSAALLGVTIYIVFGTCIIPFVSGDVAQIVNAFVFALIPAAVIIVMSSVKKLSSTMMILVGIAMMYMFNAFTTFLKFNASAEDLQEIYLWSLGTLTDTDSTSALVLLATLIGLILVAVVLANKINVIGAGDKEAISMGESPTRVRIVCFVVISIATAVAVCYTGTIGFVGLVAPHIARLIVGSNNKVLIPTAAIIGAILIVVSDIIVRSIPQDLPIGVITAVIGTPIFLYFLFSQRKKSVW